VTVLVELVLPTVTGPKFSDVADSVTGALPVPESRPTLQLFPAAILEPQVLLATAKPALAVIPTSLPCVP